MAASQRKFSLASISQMNQMTFSPFLFSAVPQQPTVSFNQMICPTPVNEDIVYEMVNRNKRKLKRANHGARPNNSRGRKARRLRRH